MTKITCDSCGQIIREIGELKEVRSLGLALRGRCPNCGGWVWCEQLWKKTKFIDLTHPTATRKAQERQPKPRHASTPILPENRLEAVLESHNQGVA